MAIFTLINFLVVGVLAGGFYLLGRLYAPDMPVGLAFAAAGVASLAAVLFNYQLVARQAERKRRPLGLLEYVHVLMVFAATAGIMLNPAMLVLRHVLPDPRWGSRFSSLGLSLLLLGVFSVQQDRRQRRPGAG